MAGRRASISSSTTAADSYDENDRMSPIESSFVKTRTLDDLEAGTDAERLEMIPKVNEKTPETKASEYRKAVIWMIVNTLATIGIVRNPFICSIESSKTKISTKSSVKVFTNKAIFTDPSLKLAQLTFAAFHFFVTWLTLFTLSRPRFAMFTPRRVAIKDIAPLAVAMALNVILPNISLAYSSVTFYQVARILLTPTVALVNYFIYGHTLPRQAIIALIPACVGVGMVSYYDSLPTHDANVKTTSSIGVIFAFAGVFASSLYTVWISSYGKKLQLSSMQLLCNQAPLSAFMLLYVIPFVDKFPVWSQVPINRWVLILMVCEIPF